MSSWWRWWWWVGQNTKSSFEMLSVGIYSLHPYVPCGAIIFVPITPLWNRILSLEIHSPCPDLCPRVSYCGAGHKYNNSDLTRILHKGGKQIPINCSGSFPQFFPRMLQLSPRVITLGFSSGFRQLFSLITSCIEWHQAGIEKSYFFLEFLNCERMHKAGNSAEKFSWSFT